MSPAVGFMMYAGAAIAFGYLPRPYAGRRRSVLTGFPYVFQHLHGDLPSTNACVVRSLSSTIAPQGRCMMAYPPDFIPSRAVHGVSTWEFQRHKVMVLAMDPAVEEA